MINNSDIKRLFPRRSGSSLSSLIVIPSNIYFATQNKDEKIYIIARQSLITTIPWIFNVFIYLAIGAVVYYLALAYNFYPFLLEYGIKPSYIIIIVLTYLLFIFSYGLVNYLKWYYNLYIITDERIIDHDFLPYSGSKISEANLVNIEDVSQSQKGILRNMFNYGDLTVQTAAEKMQFTIVNVPNPTYLRNTLVDLAKIIKDDAARINL